MSKFITLATGTHKMVCVWLFAVDGQYDETDEVYFLCRHVQGGADQEEGGGGDRPGPPGGIPGQLDDEGTAGLHHQQRPYCTCNQPVSVSVV